ncbi:hypothetical protein J4H56_18240 [Vibrio alginolyticus]|uniref:hypothetical protein n=1 Tax=Vibrio alginolyticus TaxID=663 RepID=UPI0010BD6827|nr:hypothetical protein [Vibrio alginolyticus]MBS9884512.1 hypothetical protein [Vibrio alginolyticus]MCS0188568.1 hypothetical protein [Vibrio alginolyticus]TKF03177.1 hypothetical protein FCV48_25350 [Vibrio alginolyticus]
MNWQQEQELVKAYKNKDVIVSPTWDTSANCLAFNDISQELIQAGIYLYEAPISEVFAGIYEPSIYEGHTLWHDLHCNTKIAKVIDNWVNGCPLSPPFFVKHLGLDLALVADGKHRLTVSHAMLSSNTIIPFLVPANAVNWITQAMPNATFVKQI